MLELRFMHTGKPVPLFDLPGRVGRAKAAREVGDTIEGLIAFLDELGGDPDLEADADLEPSGDEQDTSWPEWHTRGRDKLYGQAEAPCTGPAWRAIHEDDEDDDQDTGVEDDPKGIDPEEDCCTAGDDRIMGGGGVGYVAREFGPGDDIDCEADASTDALEGRMACGPVRIGTGGEARHGV